MKFLVHEGYAPGLDKCTSCGTELSGEKMMVSLQRGGLICPSCVEPDEAKGTLKINIAYAATAAPKETGVLARLFMRGLKPGISYLVYRVPAIKNAEGATIDAQGRASRIVIK